MGLWGRRAYRLFRRERSHSTHDKARPVDMQFGRGRRSDLAPGFAEKVFIGECCRGKKRNIFLLLCGSSRNQLALSQLSFKSEAAQGPVLVPPTSRHNVDASLPPGRLGRRPGVGAVWRPAGRGADVHGQLVPAAQLVYPRPQAGQRRLGELQRPQPRDRLQGGPGLRRPGRLMEHLFHRGRGHVCAGADPGPGRGPEDAGDLGE